MTNDCIKSIIELIIGLLTLSLGFMGLNLWRAQLKGGDLYKYCKEALFELKKLLNLIDSYRYIFLSIDEENKIWHDINNQYYIYENKIILINILSNGKLNDHVDGLNMKDYLTKIMKYKYEKEYLINESKSNEQDIEERKKMSERLLEIDSILKQRKEVDLFGKELDEYFNKMCVKLKKHIK